VYILVAGTILLNNMSLISMIPLELRKRRIERAVLTQFGDELDDAALRELATGPVIQRLHLSANRPDGLDECTREMFSLAMLVRLGKVSENDIKDTFAAFRRLDVNDEGVLNSKSIIAAMIHKRRLSRSVHGAIPTPPEPPHAPLISASFDQNFRQQPVARGSEETEGLRNLWFGEGGSIHVDTVTSQHYPFQDPESGSILDERSSLLHSQEPFRNPYVKGGSYQGIEGRRSQRDHRRHQLRESPF
jgi:alkylhydroperoxidase/carboxymuconolactone decarboxylase family protein YurZ